MVAVAIPDPFPVLFGEYSSFFRGVLEYFPGRIGVLSAGDWGNFRTPVPVFPQEWPGKCGNKPKKSLYLISLIDIYLSVLPENFLKKSGGNVWKLCFTALLLHPLSRGKVTRTARHGDGPGRKKEKNFRKSLAVQKNSLPLRLRSERERQEKEIFERIFIPTKVVQVSRPDGCPDRMSRQLDNGY